MENLLKKFKDLIFKDEAGNFFTVNVESWKEISEFLKNNKEMSFDYLMSITAYDLGDSIKFGVAYNLYSTSLKQYIEIRVEVEEGVEIPTVSNLWKAADWHEREAYDLMGIKFTDHPYMKRILLPEDWEGYPLRKDYKTPEYYNGMPVPKDKSYWE
ncbi:MAG: NADH-quinone oxidoreductase subunit C [Candidatus Marinimicrobia bacterium]|nr:NADH-quinone oxidoreductase subunit C [Candidatus Neomarinimicrobiota bacterium]